VAELEIETMDLEPPGSGNIKAKVAAVRQSDIGHDTADGSFGKVVHTLDQHCTYLK
jgi:hypothetical protein